MITWEVFDDVSGWTILENDMLVLAEEPLVCFEFACLNHFATRIDQTQVQTQTCMDHGPAQSCLCILDPTDLSLELRTNRQNTA